MDDNRSGTLRPITTLTKVGYGSGGIVAAIVGDFMILYFMFFLTVSAGVDPRLAGTVIMIATIWQAIMNLIVGSTSDKKRYDKDGNFIGKKRPFLQRAAIPLGAFFALLYTVMPFDGFGVVVYYIIMAVLFSTAYVCYYVPYVSMAGALSTDIDERTSIRRVATTIEYIGTFIMGVIPPLFIDRLIYPSAELDGRDITPLGYDDYGYELFYHPVLGEISGEFCEEGIYFYQYLEPSAWAWTLLGVILGGISIILLYICIKTTKGRELDLGEDSDSFNLKESIELLKNKQFLILLLFVFLYFGYYSMTWHTLYIYKWFTGYSGFEIAIFYIIVALLGMVFVNVMGFAAEKYDKKKIMFVALLIGGTASIIYSFTGLEEFWQLVVFAFTDAINGGAYWTIMFLMIYEAADLDEFKGGKRREGSMTGLYMFFSMIGTAVFAQINGILLHVVGYDGDAAEQTPEAMHGILQIATLYPGILVVLCGIVLLFSPMNRKNTLALSDALVLKREGKEYSTEGFKELLR